MNIVHKIAAAARHGLWGFALALATASSAAAVESQELLKHASAGRDWPAGGGTFSEQRFSPLEQINQGNVGELGLAWSLELPDVWNVSSTPVAVDGVIYMAVGYTVLYAVDGHSGRILWTYDAGTDPLKMRMGWGIRGIAYWEGRVYAGVQDGRLIALDAATGELAWEVMTTEPGDNRYITGAPRVFNGKVLIGHGGADYGRVRGYVTAYDAATGQQLWRWWTVPGNPADGFENPAMEMAAKTWTGEWWKSGGGGTVWHAMTYDPDFNRVYLGTGNGSPWNQKLRSPGGGDNLFLSSVVALDADTGEYVWHYQTNPGETWDYNSSMDMVLADVQLDGTARKLLMHAPKNGFFYVIDRQDGKLLSAGKIAKVTWASHVDLTTGRPVELPGVRYPDGESIIYPGPAGAHNWQPMAYSPDTGLMYIPTREMAGYYDDRGITQENWSPTGLMPVGVKLFFDDIPRSAATTYLQAWNPVTQRRAWKFDTPGGTNGGVLVTRGGLVFQGRSDGDFSAIDADTGALRWRSPMGVGTQAAPITYEVDGVQYVSILAGWAGSPMLMGSLSAQSGWVGRAYPRRLLTYRIGGKASLPPSPAPLATVTPLAAPDFQVDAEAAERGKLVYATKCMLCHGAAAVAGGYAPDLRASPLPLQAAAFDGVVRDGAMLARGMPPFPEFGDAELNDLRHYIRQRAEYEPGLIERGRFYGHMLWVMFKMKLMAWGLLG
ncbi:PQQ-dependent dehydrogenase, methanol/ethanol family [Algiphilus sp. W345]|uniref:PQQ-dependent dehydrogenase, methanol/ethanol family n=1 Tax=Banduia mediterranea TaxID=3075609 RepID=A0ABU2WGL0_9GAMM|nr:PQQ-dependent dehydrogenase, methanol/ethanol family [Algiphilus sp. W345]MDT0496404.1 PQQ-dependent dehydrogenase, methanol/ethanol family [Algiphilus sp. W345]